ncbi:MAG TPA: aldehyde dehydrogenase family protein [Alloiococcus sp.]|nr:aldehyde dehydrogenase family protein [Alloiococcus sp.]
MKTYEKIFINGKWQEANSNDYKEVTNTATEEVIAKVKSSTEDDVDQAVQAAKNAFNEWNELKPEERAEYVQKILDGIKERQEEIAETITKELGSAKKFSKNTQAQISVREMEATLKDFKNYTFEEELNNTTVLKEGAGVVACITPWNYPLNQIQRKVTPALLAGNTVVVKPASETPLTAFIYAEIVEKAGLPAGVFNLVTGKGSIIGDYLAGHEDVAVISFTGSTEVGKGLYEKASTNVKKIVLELGGKSVMLYLEGGDLEAAIKQSAGTVIDNQGQTCSALSRLLVPKEKLEETEAFIKEYYKDIKVGNPADDDVRVGPMVSEDQYNTVLDYIKKGQEEGAEVLVGGKAIEGKGFFIEPTVFTNVTNDMTIAREEIFGPVLTVLTYDTVEEAIEIANDSPYGLSGAVVGPQKEAVAVARKLRTGNVTVNQGDRNPSAPFGGYKESGFGRENGTYAIEDYVELKAIFK